MCAYIYLLFLASPEILLKYLWNTIFAKLLNILACKSLVNMNMWHKFLRNQVSYLLVGRTLIIVFLRVPPPIYSLVPRLPPSFESREVLGYLSIEYVTSRVERTQLNVLTNHKLCYGMCTPNWIVECLTVGCTAIDGSHALTVSANSTCKYKNATLQLGKGLVWF